VCDLNGGHDPSRLHEGGDAPQGWHVRLRPQTKIAVGDAALLGDGGGLDKNATGPTQCQPAPMGEMKILRNTVTGGIGRHWRDHDAVLEGDVLDRKGGEKQRLHARVDGWSGGTWRAAA
jgi:hypothetical protein